MGAHPRSLRHAFALVAMALVGGCVSLENLANGVDEATAGPCADPTVDRCGAHGSCVARAGVRSCVCEPGYGGAACETCADGFQDRDGDRVCEPGCSAAFTCKLHATCDDGSGRALCACAVGYADEQGACTWRGGPRDPGFGEPDTWQVGGGVTLDPRAPGLEDRGIARFPDACDPFAFVRQKFPMPSVGSAEPFALEVTMAGTELPTALGAFIDGVEVGTVRVHGSRRARLCLGERIYGPEVELALRGRMSTDCGGAVTLDHVAIVPAAECAGLGKVVNGDFEGNGGWVADGVAEVATGSGTHASRGGHLATATVCQDGTLSTTMSAPSRSLARPALSFSYKGTSGKKMRVGSGAREFTDATLGEVVGTNTFQIAHLCLSEWAKGASRPLTFHLPAMGGECTQPGRQDFVFDDVTFVEDPDCPEVANVVDGGFERGGVASSWTFLDGRSYTATARVYENEAEAHSGKAHLDLSVGETCQMASARQTVTIPSPTRAGGPAVKVWYRLPAAVHASFYVMPGGMLEVSERWTQKTFCIDPKLSGQAQELVLYVEGGTGACGQTYLAEHAAIDDVEVTTDPSCAAR